MEPKDREHFDEQLLADDPARVHKGTQDLMKLMGIRIPPAPAPAGDAA